MVAEQVQQSDALPKCVVKDVELETNVLRLQPASRNIPNFGRSRGMNAEFDE